MDDVLGSEPRIDLVKCDVEGAELLVVLGGQKTIERTKPVLFLEMLRKWSAKYNYHPDEIIALLGSLGYVCFSIDEAGPTRCKNVTEATRATNFLFLDTVRHGTLIRRIGEGSRATSATDGDRFEFCL